MRFRLLTIAVSVALAGCATQADTQYLRREVSTTRRLAADTQASVATLQREVQELRGSVEEMQHRSIGATREDEILGRLSVLEARIDRVARGWPQADPEAGLGETGVEGVDGEVIASSDPDGLRIGALPSDSPLEYRQGIALLRNRDWQAAIEKFREFQRRDPRSDLADDAQFWIGEAYFAMDEFNRAILELNDVLLRYRRSARIPAALLRQGEAFEKLGDRVDARLVLQKLVAEHPETSEAEEARQRLEDLSS